jgi:hypothetical protein
MSWVGCVAAMAGVAAMIHLIYRLCKIGVSNPESPYYFNDVPGHVTPEPSLPKDWAAHYREFYFALTMTPTPLLIASFEDARAGRDSGDDEAVATHLIAQGAEDLPEALLRAARLADLLLGTRRLPRARYIPKLIRPLLSWLRTVQPVDARTRARYCAVYDFFFAPQDRFHVALAELDDSREIYSAR